MDDNTKWIELDELTGTEKDLLKELADQLENPPDCLTDYSKYWSDDRSELKLKGENYGSNNITAEKGTAPADRDRGKPSDHGQRREPDGAAQEPRDRTA